METNLCVIGAGQLGSRHLQALKSVKKPLHLTVIDPNPEALHIAKERYDSILVEDKNTVIYALDFEALTQPVDLSIIATSSAVRKEVLLKLLEKTDVRYLILEKLLFQKREDLKEVELILKAKGVKVWVNCPMRIMPFYQGLKHEFNGPVSYELSGSNYGLVTNLIHYLDYMVYLTGCDEFNLDTSRLDKAVVSSKRVGYLELNGTIRADFRDGSIAEITCFRGGQLPLFAQIYNSEKRVLINESVQKAYFVNTQTGGELKEIPIKIPYQSEMTTSLVNQILETGDCNLPTYQSSAKTHNFIMKDLIPFINEFTDYKEKLFPFT